ncbi:trans-sulfuration enzyme family protein [Heyndrickxia acidiproducens]|uniref:trans-sulfuration enzyme family protein n=1 Tax=Heyndrickxia acidiproducens TaxID=1121084 RepID=UPI00037A406D|nr:aminotransferase class I/II-fold pyridoxal phosphate-dependent enzyme [Heyndrickxia acidiproducens]
MHNEKFFKADQEICLNFEEGREEFGGAVIPPVFGNTVFTYPSFEALAQADLHIESHYVYRRGKNPTVEIAEKKLAALERGEQCITFSSGMAAINAALMNSLGRGDHLLLIGHIYSTTIALVQYLEKFGITYSTVYDPGEKMIEQSIRPNTRAIYIESPTHMLYRVVNLKRIAEIARRRNICTIVDNSWATPLFQKPLTWGIDIVVHSASKYLGGHSDCLGGAVISSKKRMESLFNQELLLLGAAFSPYDASLLIRGLRSLPLRMKAHEANAKEVAAFLQNHPAVKAVHYPGLPTQPDFGVAEEQMLGFSGLLSFELHQTGFENMVKLINALKVFKIGVSWGSFESLVWSPFYGSNEKQLQGEKLGLGLIRLAIGLEDPNLLIDDLQQGLAQF